MNRKLVGAGASSIAIVIIVSIAAYSFMQPTAKPKFHPIEVTKFDMDKYRVYFKLQNLGDVKATQVNVSLTMHWEESSVLTVRAIDGNEITSFMVSTQIPLMEAKEVNEYYADLSTAVPKLGGISSSGSPLQAMTSYDFFITCAENVTETVVLVA